MSGGAKWIKEVNHQISKSFKKIRISTNRKKPSTKVTSLLQKRESIKQNLATNNNQIIKTDLEEQLKKVDEDIVDIESHTNYMKLKEQIENIEDDTENLNCIKMWQVKKIICSKLKEKPVAKKDENGIYVTEHSKLKKLYASTYQKRMEHRKIIPHLEHLYTLKMELFKIRYEVCRSLKSDDWTENDLVLVLKSLKRNKSADSNGLVYELFRPEVIGTD